jgi:2-dehydro-3-deoxyphosphogluconate aldolase/(4S)-4-hydroxy-2-oxoglutarate aldolase
MNIRDILTIGPLMPVLTIEDTAHAVPLARSLVAGGIRVLEITLRTRAALEAARLIATQISEAVVGVGTVTRAEEFVLAKQAGARFAVSPGFNADLAAGAQACGLPFLPGVMTPSDIIAARTAGYHEFKLFPAVQCGGVGMLKALAGPFPDVSFCPTGGITLESAGEYLAQRNVLCVGGSWVAPPAAVASRDWGQIVDLARRAVRELKRP